MKKPAPDRKQQVMVFVEVVLASNINASTIDSIYCISRLIENLAAEG